MSGEGRRPIPALALCALLAGAASAPATAQDGAQQRLVNDLDLADFVPGRTLDSALRALNRGGHRIAYSTALVKPEMILAARPRATTLEGLLAEVLAPWGLRAVLADSGDWVVQRGEPAANSTPGIAAPGLAEAPLGEIDVTASRFAVAAVEPSGDVLLTRDEVRASPHLTDDAVRLLNGLPGVAGGDISAQLNVRGGRRDELLIQIDGSEIRDPFHIREANGAISLVDTNLVEEMRLVSGGATADLGWHMSGVLDIRTLDPARQHERRSALGVSFINAFLRSQGSFDEERGRWLASARRGYLDLVMKRIQDEDEEFTPRYQDAFAKVAYDLSPGTTLAAHALLGTDELTFVDSDGNRSSGGDAETGTLWLTLDHEWSESLRMSMIAAGGSTDRRRSANEDRPDELTADLDDSADFQYASLRQDWAWQPHSRHLFKWGVSASRERADYDYRRDSFITDPFLAGDEPIDTSQRVLLDTEVQGTGGYAAWRTRLASLVVAEVGARWDRWRYDDAGSYDRTSPRVNLVYQPTAGSELRLAWSSIHQPHAVDELQVQDGASAFFPPERAEQIVAGFEQRLGDAASVRVDVYRKRYSDLRPQFMNLFDPFELIPEAEPDRVRVAATRARVRGVELTLRGSLGEQWSGRLSYARSKAEEDDGSGWLPRFWDQRDAASMNLSWEGVSWRASLSGIYHSAWPTTELTARVVSAPGGGFTVEPVLGPRNGERLDSFLRLDLRASREVRFTGGSALTFYVEIFNVLNRKNACCTEEFDLRNAPGGGAVLVEPQLDYWLPLLPSFGVQYEF